MKVSYALIGFGGIAQSRIAKEGFGRDTKRFAPPAGARLAGATDIDGSRQTAAQAMGLKWYPSFDDVLADKTIDAVFIATGNTSHAPLAARALESGRHVILEKPLATNLRDAKALHRLAKRKGLSLSVDHMMVYNAWNVTAAKTLACGKLGTVNDCCFHMEFAFGYEPYEAASWRCSDAAAMGGPVGDVASHCFYMAEYVFGKKITSLAAVYYPKIMKTAVEDGAYVKFRFEDGTEGSVRAAFSEKRGGPASTVTNLGYEIYGDKAAMRGYGVMFQLSGHPWESVRQRLELDDGRGTKELKPGKIRNIYRAIVETHAKSIISKRPLDASEAVHNLALLEAVHKSAAAGGKLLKISC